MEHGLGIFIASVEPNSGADRAGIQVIHQISKEWKHVCKKRHIFLNIFFARKKTFYLSPGQIVTLHLKNFKLLCYFSNSKTLLPQF